ncbi:PA14 domain-containing protein [uncultured Candidatus Kuenenia sp.]|uniref:PA14 domain-containing protein n=1 Tax=uncultured Candidatus Kuenenia sp. TaxID=1048336 RepID=UPI0025D8B5DC|nr:PA14 domain-containing protein [uncultured Candidatus Kuenenia sp.]
MLIKHPLKKRLIKSVLLLMGLVIALTLYPLTKNNSNLANDQDIVSNSNILYLSTINPGKDWQTTISITNSECKCKQRRVNATLTAYDKDGLSLEVIKNVIRLRANKTKTFHSQTLPTDAESLRVESNGNLICNAIFKTRDGTKSEVVPAIKESSRQLDFPALLSYDDLYIYKTITLLNPNTNPASVDIVALDKDGYEIDLNDLPSLSSMESKTFSLVDIFGARILKDLSTVRINSDSNIIGLQFVDYPAVDLVGLPALTTTSKGWTFPIATKGENFDLWTKVGILNPGNDIANVNIEAFDTSNDSLGIIHSQTILPGVTYVINTANIDTIEGDAIPSNTAILKITSTQPVIGYEVIGVLNGSGLSAVMGIPDEDQTSVGFELIGSMDGEVLNTYSMMRMGDGSVKSTAGSLGSEEWRKNVNIIPDTLEIISEPTAEVNKNVDVSQNTGTSFTLEFPLKDVKYNSKDEYWTPYTAKISAVFDHTMKGKDKNSNNYVVAYTGEGGSEKAPGTCEKENGMETNKGCGYYKKGDDNPFIINNHYVGVKNKAKILQYDGHSGYDYKVELKTPVYAAAKGKVVEAEWNVYPPGHKHAGEDAGGGYFIRIKHDNDYTTSYLHLFDMNDQTAGFKVAKGDNVDKEQIIAYSGNTGAASSGPHLHFEVRKGWVENVSRGTSIDPYGWHPPVSTVDPCKTLTGVDNTTLWAAKDTLPQITSISPSREVAGTSVTITGKRFGTAKGTVKFGTVEADVTSWSDTEIVATVPDGNGTVYVRVTTAGKETAVTSTGDDDKEKYVFTYTTSPTDNPPSVSITSPANGSTVAGNVTVSASASDDKGIGSVKFYLNDTLQYTDTTSPYSWPWDTTQSTNISHNLKVIAYDTTNQTATSQISVTVNNTTTSIAVSSFKINNDASSTTSRTVTLNNTATGSPAYYMASESSSFSGASWQSYSQNPGFTLSSGNGNKTVYFKVKNIANTESSVVSDSINLNESSTSCTETVSSGQWKGEYYNNKNLSGSPVMTRNDGSGNLNFDWGSGSPSSSCGVNSDDFSVRWTRTVSFDANTYRFTVTCDDGFRLYVDGSSKLEKWIDQGSTEYTVDVSLSSGNHTIKMEYYEAGGGAVAKLSWEVVSSTISVTSFKINNDASSTTSRTVTLNNTATGSPAYYMASESSSFNNAIWQTYSASPSFTLSSGNGNKTVYFKVKNSANTESSVVNDSITLSESTSCTETVSSGQWKGEYYNNKNLSGSPVMTRDDGSGNLNFDWGSGSPSSSCDVNSDDFSVRWTRTVSFDASLYRFKVTCDDGFKLYVDGSSKLEKWIDQGSTEYTVDVSLSSGNHTIKMEYYEAGGGAVAKLSWEVASSGSVPGSITDLTATAECDGTASQVRLNWSAASNATSYDVYRNGSLYYSGVSGTQFINSANITSGTSYSYYVQAKNSYGSTNSNTVSATAITCVSNMPGSITDLTATAECDGTTSQIRLNWSAASNATSYDVYRNGSLYYSGVSVTQFINSSNITTGTSYSYHVQAKNSYGSTNSNTVSATAKTCGGSTSQSERITNGSFSSGTSGWTLSSDFWAGTNLSNYRTSPGYAAGGVDSSGTPKNNAYGSMYQAVTIPSNATSATISFWYNITTSNESGYDALYTVIKNSSGSHLATVATFSNADKGTLGSYSKKSLDVTSYKGQTVTIYFLAMTDSANTTVFRIDDVSLMSDGN